MYIDYNKIITKINSIYIFISYNNNIRIEKAKTMSRRDIFMAAKGAGNRDKLEGKESDKSKKRRAMAGNNLYYY